MSPTDSSTDEGPRSKRSAIIAAAVDHFGEHGFEATMWSQVADEVGIGQTALYHYFQSKAHCLYVIMEIELARSLERFHQATDGIDDPHEALDAACRAIFEVAPQETLQLRILQNYQNLLARPRKAKREEEVRQEARRLLQANQEAWRSLLNRGMEAGAFPRRDTYLLTQAILAQVITVWQWYRPNGSIPLSQVSEFIQECVRRLVVSP
ncbi:TetR/AcrR family transcriptional regulator [Nocardioides daejeonensis]|uniref:TetR/AcrR family transcriptional regulator n=1 Tax=Nocardioides daejeonensis TaxID=1046556 RepID=UPI000D750645|nr:TetR/AcrR family transcriptional regulator [Nocardioides daejeonensis]